MIQWVLLRSLMTALNYRNHNIDDNNNNRNMSSDAEQTQPTDESKEVNGNGTDHLSEELLHISIGEQSLSNISQTNGSHSETDRPQTDRAQTDSPRTDSPRTDSPRTDRARMSPTIHVATDAPICSTCEELEYPFFSCHCLGCREILSNMDTSIAQIFAIMRQWVPQSQQNIELLVRELLRRGAHVDDRDGLTDVSHGLHSQNVCDICLSTDDCIALRLQIRL